MTVQTNVLKSVSKCTNCDGTNFSWEFAVLPPSIVHIFLGRAQADEMCGGLVLGCDECSETLMIITDVNAIKIELK